MAYTIWSWQQQVKEFHRKVLPPSITNKVQVLKLMEEVGELARALHKDDPVATADGITDCVYVLLGMANLAGLDLEALLTEVHRANMTKTGDGTLSPRGKAYQGPQLKLGAQVCPTSKLSTDECLACTGESCWLCQTGHNWHGRPKVCQHDVLERHDRGDPGAIPA